MDNIYCKPSYKTIALLCLFLTVVTVAAFEQVRHCGFVYDDSRYITDNPTVTGGVTAKSILSAFMTQTDYWYPITCLSHMLDCELFGLDPYWHHLVNLFFHIVNVLLLFYVLMKMTNTVWCSAFVAALFAVHPLRVESVAWITERKDVLSGLFFMLALVCYTRYVRRPGVWNYLLVVLFYCLELMSKPILVTMPFVLLLLDYWPLGRFGGLECFTSPDDWQKTAFWRLILEKVPLFFLSAVSSVITLLMQSPALKILEYLPLVARLSNAAISYLGYVSKMIFPIDLAVLYPYPEEFPIWHVVSSIAVLLLLTFSMVYLGRQRRYLLIGWLWYLGMLVPVIGVVQSGSQAMADRFTYLPSIGLFIIVSWGVAELASGWRWRRGLLGACGVAVIVILVMCTRRQIKYWRDEVTLYKHAVEVTNKNYVMLSNLGNALYLENKINDAEASFRDSLSIRPDHPYALCNLGNLLRSQGKYAEAIDCFYKSAKTNPDFYLSYTNLGKTFYSLGQFDKAVSYFTWSLKLKPDCPDTYYDLGVVFQSQNQTDKAIAHYRHAIQLKPNYVAAYNDLGNLFWSCGRLSEAIDCFYHGLRYEPNNVGLHVNLAGVLVSQGKSGEAISHYREALRLKPDCAKAYNDCGALLAIGGNFASAIKHLDYALKLDPNYPDAHYNLGNVLRAKGRLDEALAHYLKALKFNPDYVSSLTGAAKILTEHPDKSKRDVDRAIKFAEHAAELTKHQDSAVLEVLAGAYAAAGQFDKASTTLQKVLELALSAGNDQLAANIRAKIESYKLQEQRQ